LQSDRDYIGFATLPEQVHRKSVKRGFEFTLMVVGESGLGKSTLVNSLFLSDLYNDRVVPDVSGKFHTPKYSKYISINVFSVELIIFYLKTVRI
jgi:septin family protein